uniref:Uncharacterized protein n=1 Tax=Anguilla anguilla TaxID=7936 RepID=A0A0E9RBI7_ANGAN
MTGNKVTVYECRQEAEGSAVVLMHERDG